MSISEAISIMISFGLLLISLISLIVDLTKDDKKGKK
jgi:hypothetical protein